LLIRAAALIQRDLLAITGYKSMRCCQAELDRNVYAGNTDILSQWECLPNSAERGRPSPYYMKGLDVSSTGSSY